MGRKLYNSIQPMLECFQNIAKVNNLLPCFTTFFGARNSFQTKQTFKRKKHIKFLIRDIAFQYANIKRKWVKREGIHVNEGFKYKIVGRQQAKSRLSRSRNFNCILQGRTQVNRLGNNSNKNSALPWTLHNRLCLISVCV